MKRTFVFTVLVMLCIAAVAQKKVAVYVTGKDPVNDIVASRLVDGLAHNGKYTAVERTAGFLNALSKEHSYERDGSVDDAEIAALGKQFSVQYVCVASVLSVWRPNDKYITARIIDVETAEVVASGSSSGTITNRDQLLGALNSLSDNFLNALDYSKNSGAKKVAVYVTKTGNRDVDVILGDQLVAGFAHSGKYVAIERTQGFLDQLSKEQGYQYSGAVDDGDLTRLGKQFGVQYVCVAKTTVWNDDYYISARLIDVATAEVVNTYNVEGVQLFNSRTVVEVASQVAEKLSGRTIREEEAFKKEEAIRKAREEQERKEAAERAEAERKQALIDRPWRDLLKKVTTNVTKRFSSGNCYIGKGLYRMYVWKTGSIYCGWWDEDWNKDGNCMYIAAEGSHVANCPGGWVYVGEYKKDKKRGDNATVYDRNGKIIYYGKFRLDKPTGTYPANYPDLSSYTFEVVNYNNGDKYIGELKDGQRSGRGLYIWENGNAWYGKWENGKRNGYGMYMNYDGSCNTGTWKNDQKVD